MGHLLTGARMFEHFWIQISLTDGYDEVAQLPGHREGSPDVTTLKFFLLGLRQRQSLLEIRDVEDLRASITSAIATVTTEILQPT
ncbi:hypothetical protein AVEN_168368-1 [Araneus ventricosus]|uniref:Uncharacterized protein n=2 Tax=Araneus ventricosus TaxID=182803 RepID=A0A4Y2NWP0_ARAVE|nr:hypothetical protein AVEN_168368-1 [Araneus ventricosus]